MKLHIGCGQKLLPGWTNLDIDDDLVGVDIKDDARTLSKIPDGSCDMIYACHILEHIGRHEVQDVLMTWNKKLKKNGLLRLAVPDFEKVVAWYTQTNRLEDLLGLIIGGQKTKYDYHKMILDRRLLSNLLTNAGFHEIKEWNWRKVDHGHIDDYSQAYLPHMDKEHGLLMSLNIEAKKL
ncbi:MAG: hypothetical protein AUH25_00755 [Thaumarchaeota archaeon 13_1_40CM_38_12]|nr:MAG: hypothetical protein AUH25_00755 [Thaumarchaeota archaeon 13_1_40CM_38_12]OLC36382.1 MAG: hypothetical protein AUH84_01660 [Thaumarchaeota archaeon 13_1_40CM_4_38_7]OLC92737.1 MAG: hypothetical protein AUI92_04480 [Thaumarchaeota archaeon 13_1_40CM_3_38_6]